MRPLATVLACVLTACSGAITEPGPEPLGGPAGSTETAELPFVLSSAHTEMFLAKLAPPLVGRVLTRTERALISTAGGDAIESIVRAWTREPGFVQAARNLIELKLSVSGTRDGIDFGLPGNLAAYLVSQDLPWSRLLTDDKCRDAKGLEIACDSGAPFVAGVLTTRAYLASRASRFNLTRSSTMMKAFACRAYPQEDTLQPRLPKEVLIPMFRATSAEEQTDERAKSGFGNGLGCYMCHGQFSAHAQLFVKFDERGVWQKDATGLQDEKGELGRSLNGLMASHLVDPLKAKDESSQMFGHEVKNLADAARVIAKSPVFVECASQNVIEYGLGLTKPPAFEPTLLASIGVRARTMGSVDPSFATITVATLTHPEIQKSIVRMLTGTTPDTAAKETTP
jgi:hypothetical protein